MMRNYLLLLLSSCFLCAPLRADGHKIIVSEHALQTLDWVVELISSAEQSVEIAAPFLGGKVGMRVLNAISAKLKQNSQVQIYLLMFPVYIKDHEQKVLDQLVERYKGRFHMMETAEVAIVFPEISSINNHMKLVVVDERYFVVGGTNLDDYMCSEGTYTPERATPKEEDPVMEHPAGARDSDVIGCGPIARELRVTFYKLYAVWEYYKNTHEFQADPERFVKTTRYVALDSKQAYSKAFENSKRICQCRDVKICFSGAMHCPNKIAQEYERLIKGAKKSLFIGNLHFNPPDALYNALIQAAARRISMTLITNGIYEGVTPACNTKFCWANRINYLPLFYGRHFYFWQSDLAEISSLTHAHVFEYHVRDILYHKKVMVVDDHILVIGSFNFGLKSTIGDYELILIIDSEESAAEQMKVFKRDLDHSKEVTPKTARSWYFDPWTNCVGNIQKQFHGFM